MSTHITVKEYRRRLKAAAREAKDAGVGALLVTPGADLQYLCGYDAVALERLTCLVITPDGPTRIVVPELEVLAAQASPIADLDVEIVSWTETEDPHRAVAKLCAKATRVWVNPQMWASHVFAFQNQFRLARLGPDQIVATLRLRKSKVEVAALAEAGAAIDRVHAKVPGMLRPGRTEREVGAQIAEEILAQGHATVDFVIVASGPNGASPHHEVSDRVIEVGDPIVVDIGGTMPSGYCSDCTRTYAIGQPPDDYLAAYQVLRQAQRAAVEHVRPGVTCASVDAAARDVLADAGLGEAFVHRTGHGIGMSTHEDPYIVAGNDTPVEAGFAFSVEPGFYLPGRYGARIEDIVVATEDGVLRCNNETHDLVIVDD
ncbi:MAG: aminopeptidase P family protein [Actinobacteria bacterium]|nr:aminopeptidase P family protein [Actinomycetota bacterium]MCB9412537.1 aminopeptidase P family protein [Actinomycetota bacterium]